MGTKIHMRTGEQPIDGALVPRTDFRLSEFHRCLSHDGKACRSQVAAGIFSPGSSWLRGLVT